jgi:hypothetical protein
MGLGLGTFLGAFAGVLSAPFFRNALEMRREKNYREAVGSVFWGLVPFGVVLLGGNRGFAHANSERHLGIARGRHHRRPDKLMFDPKTGEELLNHLPKGKPIVLRSTESDADQWVAISIKNI